MSGEARGVDWRGLAVWAALALFCRPRTNAKDGMERVTLESPA